LTDGGIAGRDVFRSENCASCHNGEVFSDSDTNALHDIGTIKVSSGERLGGALTGIDTPTLRGIWSTAPYLHDGSAASIADAVSAHNGVSLGAGDMASLVAYLKQIDANEVSAPFPNVAPTVDNPGNQSGETGTAVNLAISASDANGDPLTYSATGLPAGLSINATSGVISGNPSTAGVSNVTVTVSDGEDSAATSFSWTLVDPNAAPSITNPGDQSGETGTAVNLPISASDANGDSLTYSATGLPAGLSINASTGVITGNPTTAGVSNVTVTVSDGEDSAATSFSWTITFVDTAAPTAPGRPGWTAIDGSPLLTWTASQDNVGVVGYIVYRSGKGKASRIEVGRTAVTSFHDTSYVAGAQYFYTVVAYDEAGNVSAESGKTKVRIR
jgi:hypothetical protein